MGIRIGGSGTLTENQVENRHEMETGGTQRVNELDSPNSPPLVLSGLV